MSECAMWILWMATVAVKVTALVVLCLGGVGGKLKYLFNDYPNFFYSGPRASVIRVRTYTSKAEYQEIGDCSISVDRLFL